MQKKIQARMNILKSLAESSWGKDKETAREYKENNESFIPRGDLNQVNLKLGMMKYEINSYS